MTPSTIEKEILIEAPVEVVWDLITEPRHIRQWFAAEAEIELRVGGPGALTFDGHGSYQLQVEAVEPPRRFAFRWVRRAGLVVHDDNTLLVEFTLEPVDGRTRMRVVESGFDAIEWSDEEKAKYVADHTNGWQDCLDRLVDLARTRA
jgi:uncharacterized protein YndB with AHSA1/START domain